MKLEKYVENLQRLLEKHPEYKELTVVYSKDDEGNGFDKVWDGPVVGNFNEDEFVDVESFEDWFDELPPINAVCIN